jgi:hypothetical protein
MVESKTHYHYIVEVPYNKLGSELFIEYRGEGLGYDWWNSSPMMFNSAEDAESVIRASDDYKNCKWRIVKVTVTNEVVKES